MHPVLGRIMPVERESVTLYGRASCPPCKRTRMQLEKAGVDVHYVDLDADPAALEGLDSLDWVTALPVVVAGDTHEWCGYRPEKIREVGARYGSHA